MTPTTFFRMPIRGCIALFSLAAPGGCDVDFERMIDQPRFETYEACDLFENGTIMRDPPAGTVPRSREILSPEIESGVGEGGWVRAVPIEVGISVLRRGQNRFDIYCAACHGRLGDGVSQVAENMSLRMPPNLLVPPIRDYPPGRVYATIRHGFGLMPSYATLLSARDRWAVVAYLEALTLSQGTEIDELPRELQKEARPWLR